MLEGGLLHSLATGTDVGVEELLPWVKALTAAAAGSAGFWKGASSMASRSSAILWWPRYRKEQTTE